MEALGETIYQKSGYECKAFNRKGSRDALVYHVMKYYRVDARLLNGVRKSTKKVVLKTSVSI